MQNFILSIEDFQEKADTHYCITLKLHFTSVVTFVAICEHQDALYIQ